MIYNYHTHTTRCHHAIGTDEEYIERAIEAGIKYLGFSEHIPFAFPDGHESFYRVDMSAGKEYVETVKALAKKYSDKIHISVGFEMEYYPSFFDKMLENAINFGAEYLILGQHFISDEWPDGTGTRGESPDVDRLRTYTDSVVAAIKSGVFSYVAHPDTLNFTGDGEIYYHEAKRLCRASKEYGVPLEINLHGLVKQRHYPSDRFFAIAGEVGAPITFGFDAHDSLALLNSDVVRSASEMVTRHRLNYIGMPILRPILK